jgi:rhodanese-related sulfurtransferase
MRNDLAISLRLLTMKGIQKIIRILFPTVRQLQTAELAGWLADVHRPPPVLLDVRRPEEFAISHLPKAIRVDPNSAAAKLVPALDPNREVVVYCSAGYRSSALAVRLQRAGFLHVHNLEGSIFQWANEDRPLEQEGKPVKIVHPYSRMSAKLLIPSARGVAFREAQEDSKR